MKTTCEQAREFLLRVDDWVIERQKELTAIPAPPFGEAPRAKRMAELFLEVGLTSIREDQEGNVLAELPGHPAGKDPLIVSAHLDTVFPAGTDVTPRVSGEVIRAPGITDDGRGLAALLALARAFVECPLPLSLSLPLLFVATVGEEGIGDLRGVRHLFRGDGPGAAARGFISLDGVGLDRIINHGVGSTRLRIRARGPGGHSWSDWGTPNPIHALGRVAAAVEGLPLPLTPRTTATVARWGGGKSINAIPQEGWIEIDLRSEAQEELDRLEAALLSLCRKEMGVPGPRSRKPEGPLILEVEELGRRPAGITDAEALLVVAALKASHELGVAPLLVSSSTDANIPMSLGIPAITLGAGGEAGGIHTLDEWYANRKGPEGILRALLTILYLT